MARLISKLTSLGVVCALLFVLSPFALSTQGTWEANPRLTPFQITVNDVPYAFEDINDAASAIEIGRAHV